MNIALSDALPILSIVIALLAYARNIKGDTKADAGQITTVIVKLESISDNVKEIKADLKDIVADIGDLKDRMTKVEQSVKSAHHRIDMHEGIINEKKEKAEE